LIGETGPALLTAASNPVNTVEEVIAEARQKPGGLNFATSNTSSLAATQLFKHLNQLDMVVVGYKGASQALTDTSAGTIDYFFGDVTSGGALVRGGKLKALGVLSEQRQPGFPDIPTMKELGYPELEIPIWI